MGHYSEAVLREFSDIHGGGKKEETPSNIGNGNESRHDREDSREKEQEEKVQCRRGVGVRGRARGRSFKLDGCSARSHQRGGWCWW